MIHVRVGKQHHVDGRQFLDLYAGPAQAPQRDEALGEYWVHEQLTPTNLDQER